MKAQQTIPIDAATLRRLSVAAEVDPRSIRKELKQPGSVRGLPGHRIRAVLREHASQEDVRSAAS